MTEEQTPVEESQEGKSMGQLAGEGQVVGHDEEMPTEVVEAAKPLCEEIDKVMKEQVEQAPMTEEEIMKPVDFEEGIFGMRGDIELVKSKVKNWMEHPELPTRPIVPGPLGEEMLSNLIIAYRNLESARMRLGKAVQAYDGGKSCYPRDENKQTCETCEHMGFLVDIMAKEESM